MKQPFLRFYLDSHENKSGERKIFLDISIGYSEIDFDKPYKNFNSDRKKYKPIKISTGCRIKPENFGKVVEKGSRKVFSFDQNIFDKYSRVNRSIKTKLEQIKNAVVDVTNQFYIKKYNPNPEEFKDALLIELGRKQGDVIKEKSVLEYLYDKIKTDREDAKQGKKNALSPNHIKTYVSLSRMFENYEIATNTQVMFSNFNNRNFQWEFFRLVDAIYRGEIEVDNPNQSKKQRKDPTGYGVKSINKYIKLLHRVLRLGKRDGYNMTLDIEDSSLMLENPPAEKEIYLSEPELKKVIDIKVTDPELLNAKQYLILASLMGLRIEDMSTLYALKPRTYTKEDKSFKGVKVYINKTKTEVIIPLLKPVQEVLKENKGKFPVFKESVNKHLKILCALLKINALEERTKISFRDGKLETLKVPKHELVTTHDCRRSFITNLGLKGVSQDIVLSITHPKKKDSNNMMSVYNNSSMVDKAFVFLNSLDRIDSKVYTKS